MPNRVVMLRSHHHLRGFIKLVLWDVYCVNGCGSSRLGYVGIGFEGNCDCRYGICMLLCWGVVLQVILASSPYSSELLFPAGASLPPGFLQCVRVCRPCAFGFYGSGLLLFFLSFLCV